MKSAMKPQPPTEAREGPARPGKIAVAAENGGATVALPLDELKRICGQLRTNELLGAAAADALEAAAGLAAPASPPGKPAKELRSRVAMTRDEPEEIPDLPDVGADEAPKPAAKKSALKGGGATQKRTSLVDVVEVIEDKHSHDLEAIEKHVAKDAEEPPELNLNPKQNHLRTDLEMWVMDQIPEMYGVDDSEELDEGLQEDAQASKITLLISMAEAADQRALLEAWLVKSGEGDDAKEPDAEARSACISAVLEKVLAVQEAGGKKKKKKKAAA